MRLRGGDPAFAWTLFLAKRYYSCRLGRRFRLPPLLHQFALAMRHITLISCFGFQNPIANRTRATENHAGATRSHPQWHAHPGVNEISPGHVQWGQRTDLRASLRVGAGALGAPHRPAREGPRLSRLAAGGMVCLGDSGRGRRSCGPPMHLVHAGTTASAALARHARNAQARAVRRVGRGSQRKGTWRAGTDVHKPRKSRGQRE